jgi:hypothetical protein
MSSQLEDNRIKRFKRFGRYTVVLVGVTWLGCRFVEYLQPDENNLQKVVAEVVSLFYLLCKFAFQVFLLLNHFKKLPLNMQGDADEKEEQRKRSVQYVLDLINKSKKDS